MDYWFLDNLDKLVPIIIAVLYFIGASRAKSKGEEEGPSPDASERARKIQEEIRRKILERPRRGESSFTGSGSTRTRTGFRAGSVARSASSISGTRLRAESGIFP